MKNLKLVLPMLAFVLAIGLSFAFVNTTEDKDTFATKFILVEEPNGWATITVNCDPQMQDCTVRYSDDLSTVYTVYDTKSQSDPAEGNGTVITINGSAPNPD